MPKLQDIPQYYQVRYAVTQPWRSLFKETLPGYDTAYTLDLDPDFQRAHVWDEKKQVAWLEYILSGGQYSRDIKFACPGFQGRGHAGPMVLVDGKQRIEAVRRFTDNEIKAHGFYLREYEDKLDWVDHSFIFQIADLKTREEILTWYLQLNAGGVVHTKAEIDKVKILLEKEKAACQK